jgi:type I restriction enzyme, S subunit
LNAGQQAGHPKGEGRESSSSVRLKPSGVEWLGDVPEHWEVARFGRLVALTTGFPFKSEGFTQTTDDIRLLRGINIAPGQVRWNDVVRWSVAERKKFAEYELRPGDIVLGMDLPIIQGGVWVAVIQESDVPSLLLQRVARIRPRQELLAHFLLLLLAGKSFSNYLSPIFTGISVPHLSPEQIKSFRVALPSIHEQEQIVKQMAVDTTAIQSAIDRARGQISLLCEYRTRLIADVVTGKLDVREATARLPDEADEPETLQDTGTPTEGDNDTDEADLDAVPDEAEA